MNRPLEQLDTQTVADLAHTNVQACYQCGKCSAGCPVADKMDLLPNQLVRLVQMGRIDRALVPAPCGNASLA